MNAKLYFRAGRAKRNPCIPTAIFMERVMRGIKIIKFYGRLDFKRKIRYAVITVPDRTAKSRGSPRFSGLDENEEHGS